MAARKPSQAEGRVRSSAAPLHRGRGVFSAAVGPTSLQGYDLLSLTGYLSLQCKGRK